MDDRSLVRSHVKDGRFRLISAFRMESITKRFGDVFALDSVSLEVQQGTIHAVVGENGAGKSTLMRILYGALEPDSGSIFVEGSERHFQSSGEAIAAGIGMVSQHYGIIPDLTALQNLILGAEGGPYLDLEQASTRAQKLAQSLGFEFYWDRDASELSPAGAQKLEIVKLLWRNARILILDEPTAMLSPADAEAVFESLKALADDGKTIVLVTHRLPEVLNHCEHVTVLRGGKLVSDMPVSGVAADTLAELIVGKRIEPPAVEQSSLGDIVLTVRNLTVRGDRDTEAVMQASLELRAGELIGIAGVDGSGQKLLFGGIAGTMPIQSGNVFLAGVDVTEKPASERLKLGLRLIQEDRQTEAIIEEWSLAENAALGLQRQEPFSRGTFIREAERNRAAVQIAERFETKYSGIDEPLASLSGGNQQRFVNGRALYGDPLCVLGYQPSRGLDIAATTDFYQEIRDACRNGATALIVSYDLDDLLQYCDRILVMHRANLIDPGPDEKKNPETIARLMVAGE